MSERSGTATCAPGANQSTMARGRRLPYCLLLMALLLGAAILQKDGGARFPTPKARSNSQWAQLYAALPMSFEANMGQTDRSVNFLSRGQGYTLFLTGREAILTLPNPSPAGRGQKPPASGEVLRLQLLGANAHPAVSGRDELPGKVNYFIGNDPSQWRANIPTYARVRYESVYPGVDLVYYGDRGGELEYDFVVAPGADPNAIALRIETQGHAPLRVNPQGDLVVQLQSGEAHLHRPLVYQEGKPEVRSLKSEAPNGMRASSHRQWVEGHYALDAQNHVHFELGPYDPHRPLVIDPVLIYATYVGGSGGDTGFAIAVDSNFDAYIAGSTNSSNFPTSGPPYQSSYAGNGDCFVTKINSYGTALIYSTYLGGSETDACTALALYGEDVLVTGYTASTNFPTKAPVSVGTTVPFQQTYGGGPSDAFITEFSGTGGTLVYSTYLGGAGLDQGQGIAVDSSGNAYVTGFTQSSNFPVTANALQSTLNGSQNVFVTTMNSSGEALLYSTYLGGSVADAGQCIQIDTASPPNMYIAGYTYSSNFPTASPIQAGLAGGSDAFVAELNGSGSALTFSTFLGGAENDEAFGIALDGSNNIYVTGGTASSNFPTTSGVFQPELNGEENAFVAKLNAGGTSLAYSTYLGGSGNLDQGNAIAVTSAGAAFVTGLTNSSNFPTQDPVQAVLGLSNNTMCGKNPCPDAFITQLNATGSALTYSTYLGGSGYDSGQGIAVDSTGDPYITGTTVSTNFPVAALYTLSPYAPPYKSTLTGTAGNAFIAKIDPANTPQISIQPGNLNFGNETINVSSTPQQITLVNPSTAPLTISNIQVTEVDNSTTVFTITQPAEGGCQVGGTLAPNGATCNFGVVFTPNTVGSVSTPLTLTDNAGAITGKEQTLSLSGNGVTVATAATVQPTSLTFASQAVGTESAPQTVTITNTGTEILNISGFSLGTSLDFVVTSSQTGSTVPSCSSVANTLDVGQSCSVYVYFTPTASGTRTATLSISDNATGSPQTVSLTGTGAAVFSLASPSGQLVVIGATQTTYTIQAQGPTSFNGAISLACSSGTTCAFSTNPIFVGNNTTMTVSNLTASTANPYFFTVTGTSGSQSFSLNMSIDFEDYSLSISPTSDIVSAGTAASYTVYINPIFGFNNQPVQLYCYGFSPQIEDTTCTFTPNPQTTNGVSPAQVKLSISTAKYTPPSHVVPRFPDGKLPPLILGLLSLAALASLTFGNKRRARHGGLGSAWLGVRVAALSLILALDLTLASCRSSTLTTAGTVPGNYVVTILGELQSNTTVNRYATTDLSVTQSVLP